MSKAHAVAVSVVIPTWNRRRLVRAAIDSVLAQTLEDFEVLVVDDGSTDGTVDWLTGHYANEPRVVVIGAAHRGVSAARNLAIEESRGRYVAFLDSDDRMLPECLASQVACLEAHPEAAVSHCESVGEGDGRDGERLSEIAHFEAPDSLAALFGGAWGSPCCMLIRSDVARALGFREDYPTSEDTEFLFRFHIASHELVWNPACLVVYRHHLGEDGEPQISRDEIARAEARLRMMREHRVHAPDQARYRSVEGYLCRRISKAFVDQGRYRDARPHVLHRLGRHPLRPRLFWWLLRSFVEWPAAARERAIASRP